MKAKFCVRKRTLLLIAGIVWMIAGFNVARLGVMSYMNVERKWYLYLMSIVVFLLFGLMFFKMSKKHTKRILGYEEHRPFWHFFDWKAYLIMTCMMSGGIGFRAAGIFPEIFIAFFYSGLGLALVDSIAREHGGSVKVLESNEKGSIIALMLPVSSSKN